MTHIIGAIVILLVGIFVGAMIERSLADDQIYHFPDDIPCDSQLELQLGFEKPASKYEAIYAIFPGREGYRFLIVEVTNPQHNSDIIGYFICRDTVVEPLPTPTPTATFVPKATSTPLPTPTPTMIPEPTPTPRAIPCRPEFGYLSKGYIEGDFTVYSTGKTPAQLDDLSGNSWRVNTAQFSAILEYGPHTPRETVLNAILSVQTNCGQAPAHVVEETVVTTTPIPSAILSPLVAPTPMPNGKCSYKDIPDATGKWGFDPLGIQDWAGWDTQELCETHGR